MTFRALGAGCVTLLVLVLFAVSAGPVEAAFPGNDGLITYSNNGTVMVVHPDGSGETAVPNTTQAWSPRFNSTGDRIVYIEAFSRLRTIHVDGTGATTVLEGGTFYSASYSTDGQRILFIGTVGGGSSSRQDGIFVVGVDGSNLRRIVATEDSRRTRDAKWSPDGSRIAYMISTDDPQCGADSMCIHTINPDGSGDTKILTRTGGWGPTIDWSPDGTKLVYSQYASGVGNEGPSKVRAVNVDGTGDHEVVDNGKHPVWSPSGQFIAFAGSGIEAVRPDGTGRRSLTSGFAFFDWGTGTTAGGCLPRSGLVRGAGCPPESTSTTEPGSTTSTTPPGSGSGSGSGAGSTSTSTSTSTAPPVSGPVQGSTVVDDSTLNPGDPVTVSGDGFAPGSEVRIEFRSTPVPLLTTHAGTDGTVSERVVIPTRATPGQHHVVIVGTGPDGLAREASAAVTVAGTPPAILPVTGASSLAQAAALALAFGLAVGHIRRRPHS